MIGNIYKYYNGPTKVRVIAIEKHEQYEWVVYYYLDSDRREIMDTNISNFYNRYTLHKEKKQ